LQKRSVRDLSARPVTGFTFKDDRTTLLCIHLCQGTVESTNQSGLRLGVLSDSESDRRGQVIESDCAYW
jgi:hypothetical protein